MGFPARSMTGSFNSILVNFSESKLMFFKVVRRCEIPVARFFLTLRVCSTQYLIPIQTLRKWFCQQCVNRTNTGFFVVNSWNSSIYKPPSPSLSTYSKTERAFL